MEQVQQFLPFIMMFVVVWFFMIMPQRKKAKQEKEFETNLKTGDKIITKGGLHGRIAEVAEQTVVVETMSGKLKMERSAISMELSTKLNAPEVKK